MATLTETAYYTRNVIKYGSIAFVVFLVVKFILNVSFAYWRKANPPPPPPAQVSFGKMPKLDFPKNNDLPKLIFKLETVQGTIPKLETQVKVYFAGQPKANVLSLDRAKQTAKSMGFTASAQTLSPRLYRFQTQTTPATTLDIDIVSGNFTYAYDFSADQTILTEKKLPSNDQAIAEAKTFLQGISLLYPDLSSGQTTITYYKYEAPNLTPAISLSEADFIRVGFSRQDLDNLPILPENPQKSPISFLFSGARAREKRIVEIKFNYNKIDRETSSTYPLKSTDTAWQELQGDSGFVANLGDNPNGQVVIRKIYLAYFDSNKAQDFLQPIFVFEGDKNFVAYVTAIDPKWSE